MENWLNNSAVQASIIGVIGLIVGSIISIVGLFLSNFLQSKSARKERLHNVKAELFMQAIEEIVQTKAILTKLPSTKLADLNSPTPIATSKITTIATNETLQAINNISSSVGAKLLQLVPKKVLIERLQTDLDILSKNLDKDFEEQSEYIKKMTEHNLSAIPQPRYFETLQRLNDDVSKRINEKLKEQEVKQQRLNQDLKIFVTECVSESSSLLELEVIAISKIREELGMDFDEINFKKNLKENQEKGFSELKKLFNAIPD